MEFWNIALPSLILFTPVVAGVLFALRSRIRPEAEIKWGMVVFGLVSLTAAFGLIRFDAPIRLEFLWPFSAEPSGYFEFALQLSWSRFIWIVFTNAILFGFSSLDHRAMGRESSGLKYIFLFAASFFSSMAYLSENVMLSLMFIEVMMFLLYGFGVQAGTKEDEAEEKHSYFKRSSFLTMAILSLLALTATGEFATSFILLLGVVLYILAFLFSRHNFRNWSQLPISLIQAGSIFFLLGRVIREDTLPDLWLPLAAIFAVSAAAFSWLSLYSASAIGSSFWTMFCLLGYLLFLRFSSGRPEEGFWGAYEAVALAAVFAFGSIFRFGRQASQGWEKVASFLVSAVLLGIISGAVPGVDIAGARSTAESPAKLVALGALTFLLALVVGKSLTVSFSKEIQGKSDAQKFLPGLIPALTILVFEVGVVLRMMEIYGESPYRMGPAYLLTNPHIVATGSALTLGLLTGLLIGGNSRFIGWIRNRERKMEEFFPNVDPVVVQWNERMHEAPAGGLHWLTRRLTGVYGKVAASLPGQGGHSLEERIHRGFQAYGLSLSHLIRFFHSGSIRAYMFLGVLLTLLASAIFLLEGR